MDESQRIKDVYERRKTEVNYELYSRFNSGCMYRWIKYECSMVSILKKHGLTNWSDLKALEVGCGIGKQLQYFVLLGAHPSNLHGIDIFQHSVDKGKALNPALNLTCSDATALQFPDRSFDVVYQHTMFTSILDPDMKKKIAAEMARVVKKDGWIIWYDFLMNNPSNRDVRGIGAKEIRELFPGFRQYFYRVSLAPPLARAVSPYSWFLCEMLERIPFLRSHYIVLMKPVEQASGPELQ